jgi:hypothetical protein
MKVSEPKRQKLEPCAKLSFVEFIMVFFGNALACDMPILEALFMSTFDDLDIFKFLSPDLLWAKIFLNPTQHEELKEEWWTRFRTLVDRMLTNLFPSKSSFADLRPWISCSSCHGDMMLVHYPEYYGVEGEFALSCEQKSVERSRESFGIVESPTPFWHVERLRARTILQHTEKLFHIAELSDGIFKETVIATGWEIDRTYGSVKFITCGNLVNCNFRQMFYSMNFNDLCAILRIPQIESFLEKEEQQPQD